MARTIRIDVTIPTMGIGNSYVVVSTEAIVENDADAEQEGRDAAEVVSSFCSGYSERTQELG
jgi:hypothetical protein